MSVDRAAFVINREKPNQACSFPPAAEMDDIAPIPADPRPCPRFIGSRRPEQGQHFGGKLCGFPMNGDMRHEFPPIANATATPIGEIP